MAQYDTLIKGGTVVDPSQGIHAPRDVAFSQGVVAAVAKEIPTWQASRVVDASGLYVTPGLVDLHVHVFEGVSFLGVPPDPSCLARGVTTVVDAGSAGADTFPGFRKYVIEVSETRILATLNISSQGMLSRAVGELDDIKWADVPRALQMIEEHRDLILGVKVRLTRNSIVSEAAGMLPLYRAREASDAAGLPIMVHPNGAWCDTLDDILAVMRERDIITHSYHGSSAGILDNDGKVRHAVREARERGILFDVGHGAGSFSWDVCERALAQGFPPTTISSDLHTGSIHSPVFDLATTVSKFLHLGLTLDDAVSKVTQVPAGVIGMAGQIGTLTPGAYGDAAVFRLEEKKIELVDSSRQTRIADKRLVPVAVIKGGRVYDGKRHWRHHWHRH